jgi:hypothetical protein
LFLLLPSVASSHIPLFIPERSAGLTSYTVQIKNAFFWELALCGSC